MSLPAVVNAHWLLVATSGRVSNIEAQFVGCWEYAQTFIAGIKLDIRMRVPALFAAAVLATVLMAASTQAAGITKQLLKAGDGKTFPKKGQSVTVHYTGSFPDGSVFDSSVTRGEPFVFTLGLGQVIKCWDQGVAAMSVGEHSVLTCSPETAYGSSGASGVIPPNATLKFDVQLLAVN